jgi:hypothetical protein
MNSGQKEIFGDYKTAAAIQDGNLHPCTAISQTATAHPWHAAGYSLKNKEKGKNFGRRFASGDDAA